MTIIGVSQEGFDERGPGDLRRRCGADDDAAGPYFRGSGTNSGIAAAFG